MIKRIFIILSTCFILLASLTILKLNSHNHIVNNNINLLKIAYHHQEKDVIGSITIHKLKINEKLYKIESKKNNVDKHVTILKESVFPNEQNSIIFIAAHSGTGPIAYFNNLDNLKQGDIIKLHLYNKNYTYIVKDMWEEKKNGYINVNKENHNQLILTTCSPTKDK